MTPTATEEEELVEIEEDLAGRKKDLADAEMKKAMGREGRMVDISDEPGFVTLWSMIDGDPITIPEFMVPHTLRKRLPTGGRAFTSRKSSAPKFKVNNVLCWLHRDHEKRAEWDEMGLAGRYCEAAHLASAYSARIHMQHRHKDQWATIQEHLDRQRDNENRDMARLQLEATLALAGKAAGK